MSPLKFIPTVALVVLMFPSLGTSQEVRTFTNQAGVAIDAELLDIVDKQSIRIRRQSDGKEFVLPIANLSLDDQQYLAAKVKAGGVGGGAGKTLVVDFISPDDRANILTTRSVWENTKIGAARARIVVPKGKWIEYYSRESMGRSILVPYRGAAHWKFEKRDDDSIWLSRDGKPPEMVAVMFSFEVGSDRSGFRRALRALEAPANKGILNVLTASYSHLSELDAIKPEIPIALSTSTTMNSDFARALSRIRLVALSCYIEDGNLSDLDGFEHLESLVLNLRDPEEIDLIQFPDLPKLKHYVTINGASRHRWPEVLAKLPQLESLATFRSSSKAGGGSGTPIKSFANNPRLDLLAIWDSSSVQIDASALVGTPKLKILALLREATANPEALPRAFAAMNSLQYFGYYDQEFDESKLDALATAGVFSQLKDFSGFYVPLLEHCPKLEGVSIQSDLREPTFPDYSRFEKAPESLRKLYLESPSNKDFEQMKIPHPEGVTSVSLSNSSIDQVELLYRFPNLERLRISTNSGRISELDLAKWPGLSYLYLYRLEDLEKISNFSSSTSLAFFMGQYLTYLSDFGEPAPNTSIKVLYLSNLPRFENLDSLSGLTDCRRLTLYNLDRLETFADFERTNPLEYLSVRDCEKLSDETRSF